MKINIIYVRNLIFWLLLIGVYLESFSQELPPIVNYAPAAYNADNQNWMLTQDPEQRIYAANNKGLLVFNGAQWDLYPSPNETILRSVNYVNGSLFSGAYMDFGFWKSNGKGSYVYTSLVTSLGIEMLEDEQIWQIVPYRDKVLFQSFNRIYVYTPSTKKIRFLSFDNLVYRLFSIEDELYFQELSRGLFSLKNGEPVLVSASTVARDETFIKLITIDKELVAIAQSGRFYKQEGNSFVPLELPISKRINGLTVYSALQLKNGNLAIGTVSEGLIIASSNGEYLYQLKQENGLSNNTALSLFEDAQSNIWVGLDVGIDCINKSTPFKAFIDRYGEIGATYNALEKEGQRYLGTNQGLYYRKDETSAYTLVDGAEEQVWMLKEIDGTIFCGQNKGTLVVEGDTAELIVDIDGAWDIKRIPGNPDLLIQGNYTGLYVLERTLAGWQLRNKIENFDISTKHFEFVDKHKILVSHEYKGVYEIVIDSAFAKAISVKKSSIDKGEHASLATYDGAVLYANKNGIHIYDTALNEFVKNPELSAIYEDDTYVSGKLFNDQNGKLWAFTKFHLVNITKDKLEDAYAINKIQIPQELRASVKGYETITKISDSEYLLGTSFGYLLINPSSLSLDTYKIQINSVVNDVIGEDPQAVEIQSEGAFSSTQNNMAFTYSMPEFDKYQVAEYQHRLPGLYNKWSPWSTEAHFVHSNLPPGDYSFEVRGRVGDTFSNNVASYSFTIDKPWYLGVKYMTLYVILGILLFVGLNWFYKRYYRKQRERLLEQTKKELELQELSSEKRMVELRNDNLQKDIEARNRELAASTMSMINKSKTLNEIKDAIVRLNDHGQLSEILKLVENNITNEEDWNFFEEAFNHADKDFFKKVKDKHPALTNNDLRLCVYLRLNMSSKEIAPLLNISHRSVEIKRYRLRKKINLEHSVNLNDYFINL